MSKEMVPAEEIARTILFVRGQRVLLDFDLARLYGVRAGNLNKAVARNRERFPLDFMFRLSRAELRAAMLWIELGSACASHAAFGAPPKTSSRAPRRETFACRPRCPARRVTRRAGRPRSPSQREIGFQVREEAPRYKTRQVR